jgi:hypothetical protein
VSSVVVLLYFYLGNSTYFFTIRYPQGIQQEGKHQAALYGEIKEYFEYLDERQTKELPEGLWEI